MDNKFLYFEEDRYFDILALLSVLIPSRGIGSSYLNIYIYI